MLRIKEGSVFDEKCDLLVLPCNSAGGVTQWVHDEAVENDAPLPDRKIPFGRVLFLPTEARYTKADFIGYAASVNANLVESSLQAIKSLLAEIVEYCKSYNCSIVNLPVLGVGAGRLESGDVLSLYRNTLKNEPETYNVYIPDRQTARLFIDRNSDRDQHDNPEEEHPRVFISYSWKDKAVTDWVFELANKLCANGVDARLDRFHLRPGMDVPQWMTNEVVKANKVLLVCDSHYAAKADTRKAGVGWETMIIQGDMMMQGEMNTKYVAIAFGDIEKSTPIYMKSKLAIEKDEIDNNFDRLLEQIFDIDAAPEIGQIPAWVKIKRKAGRT